MKKLLLILLCVPLMFSCGDKDKTKKLEDRIAELENKQENNKEEEDKGTLDKELSTGMISDGYTGKGTHRFYPLSKDPDAMKYVGEWKDGKQHGQGTWTLGGSKYVGGHKNGNWHGKGIYTHHWGNEYVGEWKEGFKDGQGTMTWKNKYLEPRVGDKYVGEWKRNAMHGQGTYTYSDGTVEKGLWRNDEFIGE